MRKKNLCKVDVICNTEFGLAAAAKVPVRRKGGHLSVRAIPLGLRCTVVVQLPDVAIIRSVSAVLTTVNAGEAGQTSASRQVPLPIYTRWLA